MIPELYFLPPSAFAHSADLPPPPLWWTLAVAGAAALVLAFALTLS